MEVVLSSSATALTTIANFLTKPHKTPSPTSTSSPITIQFVTSRNKNNKNNVVNLSSSQSWSISCVSLSTRTRAITSSTPPTFTSLSSNRSGHQRHWMVVMEALPPELNSKPEIIDYYVKTLERVLGSQRDAQMCIYNASYNTHFGFCCDIDEETSHQLARLSGVLLVRPDPDFNSVEKDYNFSKGQSHFPPSSYIGNFLLFPLGTSTYWVVQTDKPAIGAITKAMVVDHYAQLLTKVLGNEKDAQMCIYHISWQAHFGFCCELDEECVRELASVPGVLSVYPDENFESDDKNYGVLIIQCAFSLTIHRCGTISDPLTGTYLPGENSQQSRDTLDSSAASQAPHIKTKKLFVTGLSFYTSEKTLRAAFEGFGELVEVKIIMDKISKRSKGYAFIEYTTEAAASAALKEMNGKVAANSRCFTS
ncbi:unnamed protein product [Ilex paraguariensis]|uniref:RRM domain-containing protein n=1 Tax=Ilex paraguariensis TaxID=185542 RepID=A0ABC8V559_9AQUA